MTTFVPYFIPIVSPGGGGGGKKEFFQALITYSLVLGLYVGFVYYDTCPTYKMKVFYNSDRDRAWSQLGPGYNVDIYLKNGYTTEERVKHNNIECMRQKGYNVQIYEQPSYRRYYNYGNNCAARIESKGPIEQILEDCKQCDVHTEITYRFNDMFRNEITRKTSFRWHKHYAEELK